MPDSTVPHAINRGSLCQRMLVELFVSEHLIMSLDNTLRPLGIPHCIQKKRKNNRHGTPGNREGKIGRMNRNNTSQTSLDFHPTPFQDPEHPAIRRTHSVDTDDVRPVCRPEYASIRSARARRLPQSEVAYRDSAEQHEHACDDIRRGCDAQ